MIVVMDIGGSSQLSTGKVAILLYPLRRKMDRTERRHDLRRIVYSIGEGLLVIALFTAALSAQNATTVGPAEAVVVAPPHMLMEGLKAVLPNWLKPDNEFLSM